MWRKQPNKKDLTAFAKPVSVFLLIIFVVYFKNEVLHLHINLVSFCTHCHAVR
jgi:hypothetical protein